LRVSWPGSSFSWTDRNDRVVAGNALKAVMSVSVRTHMERDDVNSLSKKAFPMSMVMDVPTGGCYATVLNIFETHHANLFKVVCPRPGTADPVLPRARRQEVAVLPV